MGSIRNAMLMLIAAECQLNLALAQPPVDFAGLYEAIRTDRLELVEDYLDAGGNPNTLIPNSPMGNVGPISVAIAGQREAIALALLRAGARIEISGNDLSSVSSAGLDETLQFLLDERAFVSVTEIKKALDSAVVRGHFDSVDVLLTYIKEHSLPIEQISENAIYSAIGKDDIARLLLDHGANLKSGVVRAAARWSSPGILRYVIQLGADPFERYQPTPDVAAASAVRRKQAGYTALDFVWEAYTEGTPSQRQAATFKMFDLLAMGFTSENVEVSAAVNGSEQLSLLANPGEKIIAAAQWGFYDTVKELLTDATSMDSAVLTDATIAALRADWDDIARLLVESGAPADGGPLHIAVRASTPGMVRFLLARGADPNEVLDGYKPVDYWLRDDPAVKPARSYSNHDILHELIEGGAEVCGLVNNRDELEQSLSYNVLWNSAPECWPEQSR